VTAQNAIQETANRKNLLLLVALRWVAVLGQIMAIGIASFGLHITLPLVAMSGVILFLVVLNLATTVRAHSGRPVTNVELLVELLIDVSALTVQLYLSGGATNPFVSLYLLQAILGAVLLRSWATWTIVAVAILCYIGLITLYRDIGLALPMPGQGNAGAYNLHIYGMFICFLLAVVLLVLFLSRINENLREQDQRLAELKRQSAEEEHIVSMGLLASGAAHELGTPLSTISVILNDWEQMPALRGDGDLAVDLAELQAQLARCKEIVSGILRSSGEARGEGARRAGLIAFFDDAIGDWEQSRDPPSLTYDNVIESDMTIASDELLRQVIFNVLDNALEASADEIHVSVAQEDDMLQVTVSDSGPGFSKEMLADLGRPYRSTKGRPGRGLGLFLVCNVLRKLGGRVDVSNRPAGGAMVQLRIPTASLSVEAAHGR
jgi:two-component system sensor histidine kinase RegB